MASNQFQISNFTGTQTFPTVKLPAGPSTFVAQLDRSTMTDPTLRGSILLDLSLDDGLTWASEGPSPATGRWPVGCDFLGGATLDRHGNLIPVTNFGDDIPRPDLSTRRVRATLTVPGPAALTTTATLTVS